MLRSAFEGHQPAFRFPYWDAFRQQLLTGLFQGALCSALWSGRVGVLWIRFCWAAGSGESSGCRARRAARAAQAAWGCEGAQATFGAAFVASGVSVPAWNWDPAGDGPALWFLTPRHM